MTRPPDDGGAEVALRADMLARELRRIARAHIDSLDVVTGSAVESMALSIAMADLLMTATASVGRPVKTARELATLIRKLPFEDAAEIVLHPGRPGQR